MPRVAFLGLGVMGGGMAMNTLKARHPITVYNRTRAKAKELLEMGAEWADTPREAAEGADVVISVVADDGASRAVWLEADGAFAGMKPGAIAIECATLSLEWITEWHTEAEMRGFRAIDAPLFGSKTVAAAGTLNLYVGAEEATLEAARPVLQAFSQNIVRLGPPTSGVIYKLINNMMGATQLAALGEAVALAEKAGLNMEAVALAISGGAASSPMVRGKVGNVVKREYDDVHFALRWMHKDLNYAVQLGEQLGVPLPTITTARAVFEEGVAQGLGDLDCSAQAEVVRRQTAPSS